ncbi:MAG TPA: histidine kinase [Paucimonas sp.]|nr:histidine kinase [Paucimonas sp.]
MHPLFSDARKLPIYLAAWLLAGACMALLLVLTGLAGWSRALLFALPVALVYGFVAMSAYYVCRAFPYPRRWPAVFAAFVGAPLFSAFTWIAMCQAWNETGRAFGDAGIIAMPPSATTMLFAAGFCLYLLSVLAHDVLIAFDSVQAAAQREAESRVLARDAELQLLRTQINPHFLFNSLNSISALTSIDPKAAREMTIALAQFFRRTLSLSEAEKIPLSEEAGLCENFLAIEKNRFGRKLGSAVRIDDEARSCLLPPMTLQPLVENAIKHGIRHLDDGGAVTVEAIVRDGWLHIAVENPAPPAASPSPGNGLGLRNIRERLAVLYGDRARISWKLADQRFLVEIALPAEREESSSR